jgi:hypothetical protein
MATKKLSDMDVRALVAAEHADALAGLAASTLNDERSRAMDYYQGDMARDMPTIEGRSAAVSTDVSDTIDGLMPNLMEIFAGGDEVIRFDPVSPEDVEAAQQESDYINHVFLQQNQGFMVLYSFIKDALLSKNGFVKVWWEETEREEEETYFGLTDDQFMMIASDPDVEIVEHSEYDTPNQDPKELDEPVSAPGG